jgi:hypothetical protein
VAASSDQKIALAQMPPFQPRIPSRSRAETIAEARADVEAHFSGWENGSDRFLQFNLQRRLTGTVIPAWVDLRTGRTRAVVSRTRVTL